MKRRNMFFPRPRDSLTRSVTMSARSYLDLGQVSAARASEDARQPVQSSGSLTTRVDDINGQTKSVHVPVLDSWTIVSGSKSVHGYRTDTRAGRRNAISVLSVTVTKVREYTCTVVVYLHSFVGLDFSLAVELHRDGLVELFRSGRKTIRTVLSSR